MAKAGLAKVKRGGPPAEFALAPPAVPTPVPTTVVLRAYDAIFRRRFGTPAPIVPGKDGALAAQLLRRYTVADLTQWLEVFFVLPDEFIRRSGYAFAIFASNVGKCITYGHQSQLNNVTLQELDAGQQFLNKLTNGR